MRTILIAVLTLFCSLQLSAQRHMDPKMIEVIKAKKVAFITEQVGLTSQEGEKFWPVYNQLEKERLALMDHKRGLEESTEDKSAKTEEYYRKLSNEIVQIYVKEGKLIEEYNSRFLSILPAEKVVKLYRSERKFRSYLMQEMRKKDDSKPTK
ncbi:MAG TPA: hypothetical protein VN249_04335 [Prolixibacteraceae bacterium]|nr:hypothetical protein [Prolixibacteraceae bacterium]